MPDFAPIRMFKPGEAPALANTPELARALQVQGWHAETPTDTQASIDAAGEQAHQAALSTIGNKVSTAIDNGLGGLTLGLSRLGARANASDDELEYERQRDATNSKTALLSNIGGALIPALVTGGGSAAATTGELGTEAVSALGEGAIGLGRVGEGAIGAGSDAARLAGASEIASPAFSVLGASPAGLASNVGGTVSEALGGGLGAKAVGGALEGGLFGAGQGLSELALQKDPITAENAMSTISSNALFGGVIGGAAGTVGKLFEKGLARSRGALDEFASTGKVAADGIDSAEAPIADAVGGEATATKASTPQDLDKLYGEMDADKLASAERAERRIAALEQEQSAAVTEARAAVKEYQSQITGKQSPFLVLDSGEEARQLNATKKYLQKGIDDPLAEYKPKFRDIEQHGSTEKMLEALDGQRKVLEDAVANKAAVSEQLNRANVEAADKIEKKIANRSEANGAINLRGADASKYGNFADLKVSSKDTVSLNKDEAADFAKALRDGRVQGETQKAFDRFPELIEANKAARAKVEAAAITPMKDLTSAKLDAIARAKAALKGGGKTAETLTQKAAGKGAFAATVAIGHALPIPGGTMAGLWAAPHVSAFVRGIVGGKLSVAVADAAAKTASVAERFLGAASKASEAVTPLATKTLAAIRYAPPSTADLAAIAAGGPAKKLEQHYADRVAELQQQLTVNPQTGQIEMAQAARKAMANRLAPVRHISPVLADQMETLGARKVAFLGTKIPKNPDMGALQVGPPRQQASDMEMRTFARYCAAAENPSACEERLVHGNLSPEDVEVMHAIYPERTAALSQQIIAGLPTLKKALSLQRQMSLSLFTGKPIHASMNPGVYQVFQGAYSKEPGTNGGMSSPKAAPQFGSVKKSVSQPTAAQSRQVS